MPENPQRVAAVGFNEADFALALFGAFGTDFAGALGFSSPLSLSFALGKAVPRLSAAAEDGT